MVKQLQTELSEKWPIYLLVVLLSGGGSAVGNSMSGGNTDQLTEVIEEIRDMRRELRYNNHEAWTYRMERDIWDDANKQLRQLHPAWIGPDVNRAKRENTQPYKQE